MDSEENYLKNDHTAWSVYNNLTHHLFTDYNLFYGSFNFEYAHQSTYPINEGRTEIDDKHFIDVLEISTFRLGKCLLVKSNLQIGINPRWFIKVNSTTQQPNNNSDKLTELGKFMLSRNSFLLSEID